MMITFFPPRWSRPVTLAKLVVTVIAMVITGVAIAYRPNPYGLFEHVAPALVTVAIVLAPTLLFGLVMAAAWNLLKAAMRRKSDN